MQGMWVSVKENISCGNRPSDVIGQSKKPTKQRSQQPDNEAEHKFAAHIGSNFVVNLASCKQNAPPCSFKELGPGDPSRNVIEKILGTFLTSPEKKSTTIDRVLKVKNSHKVVEKFEKYRETVKQKVRETGYKHPRTSVDGNELLCFYVTTMTCQTRKRKWFPGPCEEPNCSLCRTIGNSFEVDHKKGFRFELSVSSEALRESIAAVSKGKNIRTAVIICRIIAGRTRGKEDKPDQNEYDSMRRRGFYSKSEYLIVNSPDAILPCFVIIFNS